MREEFAEAPKPYSFTVRPELSAAFGHAQAILAFCYEFSMGCQPDYPLCEDLYKKAALHGSGLACTRLSFLRRYGRPSVRIDRVEAEGWSRRVNEIGPSAIQWLVEAAQTYEIPSANYALGLCYHDGVGMPRSPEMAVHFYRKAAAAEHPRGLGILGYCYGDGYGVEKDETLAFGYYLRAAQVGESVSMYNVAHALEEGVGTERNLAEAVNWYRRAAALGNCFAQNALGYLFEEGFAGLPRDEVAAVRWYALAAHQGYPWAQCNLGFCLVSGIGVAARDEVRGAYWYHAAARQGHSRAQHNLGHAYLYGIGVRRDEHRAVEWFLRAARANNPFALHSLGYCFHHGIAVPTDERRALALYRRAAKLGHPPAQLSLGRCYLDGVGVSTGEDDEPDTVAQNNRRAFKWIRRAALAGGNDLAMNTLAHLYEAGIGVRASFRKAITHYWNSARMGNSCALANLSFITPLFRPTPQQVLHLVRLAANEGQPRAQERLGDLLFMGNPRLNLPRDYSEAVMWYELSAMGGNITAMTKLGNCLEGGIGCERDVDSAVDWFAKAAALGDADAARYLAPLLALRPSRRRRRRIRQSAATIPGQADGDSVIVLSSSPSTTSPLSSSLHLTGPSGLSITIPAMPLTPPSTPAEADSAADDDELGAESYIEDDGAEDDDDDDYEEYEEYEEYDDDDFYDDDDSMEPSSAAYTRGFSIVAGTVAPAA
ncbi:uncharacterized protein EV422DRAFT_495023 [Fimicolochytrium jonesii]|uniref:uncharacterized protein n=1 Tax=Fimicolochytrium jonesii TaxID=1396493 RepID=UPI0022FE26D5|nr:uncharacterized protein EV422DRAFT_495023 [Fimicolochytrium jonesii]KAI8822022.1 hypothetical protein EV422DRAFT_495023 [Fimicolochytrium jonesii]